MNDKLKDALIDDIKSAKDFAVEQTPDVVQHMVGYHATVAWLWVAAATSVLLIYAICVVWVMRQDDLTTEDKIWGIIAAGILPVTVSLVVIASDLPTVIKATWFVKWFIVEKIMELVA